MYTYQVSLKSETVGFKFSVILGDLTRNDPNIDEPEGTPMDSHPCQLPVFVSLLLDGSLAG